MPRRVEREASQRKKARNFYQDVLDETEKGSLRVALELKGVDQELAVLRLRLRTLAKQETFDFGLMLRAVEFLRRLVETKYRLTGEESEAFAAEIPQLREVLTEILKPTEVVNDGNAGSG